METKTSNFQIIILVVFSFFVILGLILFATGKSQSTSDVITPVVAWGTVDAGIVNKLIANTLEKNKDSLKFSYVQKDPSTFEKELIEALADGSGPDVVLIPQDLLLKHKNKLYPLAYASYPLRTFKDQFIDAGSIYLDDTGVLGVPFMVDPIVMYWNKTHFVNASIVSAPKYWDDFSADVAKLTRKDSNYNVLQSGAALGEYSNILHAKDIVSMLFIQAGAPIVGKNSEGAYVASLAGSFGNIDHPAESALSFYTDFANPIKGSYSWNKSLKSSMDSFLSGDTSIYFGYASELPMITLKNPNLNFDISSVPQVRDSQKQTGFAKVYAFSVLKASKNTVSAFNQIFTLTSKDSITDLTSIANLPPVRKDVLANKPDSLYMQTFYDSALRSEAWPDPDPVLTEIMFKNMIESTIIGKIKAGDAVGRADRELESFLKNK